MGGDQNSKETVEGGTGIKEMFCCFELKCGALFTYEGGREKKQTRERDKNIKSALL